MLSLYIHGDSPLHHARAGLKTGLFAVWVLALTLLTLSRWTAGAAVVGAVTAYLVGFGLRRGAAMIASDLRALWLFYVVLFAAQWIFTDAFAAGLMVARVLGLVLTAQVLTRTTRIADMTGVAEAVLRPVERIPWAGPRLARAGFRADRGPGDGPGALLDRPPARPGRADPACAGRPRGADGAVGLGAAAAGAQLQARRRRRGRPGRPRHRLEPPAPGPRGAAGRLRGGCPGADGRGRR